MRLFIFAIGGTGSRVLKSLIMLSAAGVKPLDESGQKIKAFEIIPIIVDPHKSNEDLKRTDVLLSNYSTIRRRLYGDSDEAEGFFATKISTLRSIMKDTSVNLTDTFIFNLSTVEKCKFRDFINYDTMSESNHALTSLLFADYQLENKMNIGFVGSPNIGSIALNQIKDSDEFKAFANILTNDDRIFFISSIFGGTGASGFPILVKNIRNAQNLNVANKEFLRRAPIGALTVLPYFNIQHTDDGRIDKADFIVKTQSALQYYNETLTNDTDAQINELYYLGDSISSLPYQYDPGENGQKNNAHLIEMIGALAPLKFAGTPDYKLRDQNGYPLKTAAYEYGLETDTNEVTFKAFGASTRHLLYNDMVKFHLLYMYLKNGFEKNIGKGYTQDAPEIRNEFTATDFYRTLDTQFFTAYVDWLGEMRNNNRSVNLFDYLSADMNNVISGVGTKKTWVGHKSISCDSFLSEMNRLSRDNKSYSAGHEEFKLFDLFNRAADNLLPDKYENIN
ncbi:MAG: hypothetical protein LKF31_00650 [Muribaculaceae bacterium]|jgi:hypothetical protein|nr:hypothetical protein [Muribaculaceae bacterium]